MADISEGLRAVACVVEQQHHCVLTSVAIVVLTRNSLGSDVLNY